MSKPKGSLPVMVAACSLCLSGAIATAAEDAPKQNKGLKQTELCAVELGSDAEQIVNQSMRVRLITIEPGGHIRQHGHAYRPTIFHILEGELTSYRGEQPGYVLRAGECDVQGREVTHHWLQNTGTGLAKYLVIDVPLKDFPGMNAPMR